MTTFYNAGAGSGKTFTLSEKLYEFLTAGNGDPGEVILTTFTVKAAEELKERVRRKLLEKGEHAKAAHVSNALIGTINGVCSSLLERYSMQIGLSPELKILDQHTVDILFEKFLASNVADDMYHQLNHLSFRFSLYEVNDYRGKETLKPCWPKLVKALVDKFRDYNFTKEQVQLSKESALKIITGFLPSGESLDNDSILQSVVRKGPGWFENRNPGSGDMNTLESLKRLSVSYNARYNFAWHDLAKAAGKLNKGFVKENPDVSQVVESLANYYESKDFKTEWLQLTGLLYDTAFKLIKDYQDYKRERGLIDFTDQEALLLDMLKNNSTVREEMSATFKMIMVDEFQDCSPLQIAVFTELQQLITDSCWVGDPKQSIYGFRGADEVLFTNTMNAVEKTGNKIEILGTSFRSRPAIVEAVNEIFTGIFKGIIPGNRITLTPSADSLKKEPGYKDPALHVVFCEAGKLEDYYTILAEKVKSICNSQLKVYETGSKTFRNIRGSDIALLFRDRANMQTMAETLKATGVAVSIASTGFQEQAEVLWMLSLLRLVINPYDSLATANLMILEGAVGNVEELIVKRLEYLSIKNEPEESISEGQPHWKGNSETARRLESHNDLISQMPLLQAIELLISLTDLPVFAARWGAFELRLANINQMLSLANEYQEQCSLLGMSTTLSGFLDTLQNHDAVPAVKSDAAITLMTIHEAKGLEWPMVIPVKTSVTYNDCKHIFNSMHVIQPKTFDLNAVLKGQQIIYIPWPFASAKKVCGSLEDAAAVLDGKLDAYQRAKKEEDRLLYVALTRAKEYLLLPANIKAVSYTGIEAATRCNPSSLFTAEDLQFLLSQLKSKSKAIATHKGFKIGIELLTAPEENVPTTNTLADVPVEYYDLGTAQSKVHTPRFLSPSAKVNANISTVTIRDIGLVNPALSVAAGKEISHEEIGNAIHLAFASWKPENKKSDRILLIEKLLTRLTLNGKIDAVLVDENFEGFWSFIKTKYQPINIWREYPVSSVATQNGEVISGIIDLLVETPTGLVLIDHKTFRGSFDAQVLKNDNEFYAGKYKGQLDSYKEILEQATGKKVTANLIHYVMQGRIVELTNVVN